MVSRSRPKPVKRHQPVAYGKPPKPDLSAIMAQLSDALALVSVTHRSLEAQEIANAGHETSVLRAALASLNAVYNSLDAADAQMRAA